MTHDAILQRVREIIAKANGCEVEEIRPEDPLDLYDYDSLDLLDLSSTLQREFKTGEVVLDRLSTPVDLARVITKEIQSGNT